MKAVRWVPWKRPLLVKLVLCSDKEELGVLGMGSASECTQETGIVNLAQFCKSHRYRLVFFLRKTKNSCCNLLYLLQTRKIKLEEIQSKQEFEYHMCKVLVFHTILRS